MLHVCIIVLTINLHTVTRQWVACNCTLNEKKKHPNTSSVKFRGSVCCLLSRSHTLCIVHLVVFWASTVAFLFDLPSNHWNYLSAINLLLHLH